MAKNKCVILACSDLLEPIKESSIIELKNFLTDLNFICEISPYLFSTQDLYQQFLTGELKIKKADYLNKAFSDPDVSLICDVSGGNLANEVLEYLDFSTISQSKALYIAYSDLTVIINAILTLANKKSLLFQTRHLVTAKSASLKNAFGDYILHKKTEGEDLGGFLASKFVFLRGSFMQGEVIGGNFRCFLKLAGSKYWPDLTNKILLLEGYSGDLFAISTFLHQLKAQPNFLKLKGIILGNFWQINQNGERENLHKLMLHSLPANIPVAYTEEIGHEITAKALLIGGKIKLKN